jgi:hypothetical protein
MTSAMIEPLESRRLFAVGPATPQPTDTPYPVASGVLTGQFTSRVPFTVIGGETLDVAIRFRNTSREAQRGLVDITFVLDAFTPGRGPQADRFDPVIGRLQGALVRIGGKGAQTFRLKALVPLDLPAGQYFVAASVDPAGEVAQGRGFAATVGAAVTTYIRPFSDVTIDTFNVNRFTRNGIPQGSISARLRNFGNAATSGSITLRFSLTTSRELNAPATASLVDQSVLLTNLRPNRTQSVRIPFVTPPGLPAGTYFLRIDLVRSGLPIDADFGENRTLFSNRPARFS